jgi:signal transduction histidine kinase
MNMESTAVSEHPSNITREKLEAGSQLHGSHWLIIFLSLVLTVGAWYVSSSQLEAKNQDEFKRKSEQVVALVKERMGLYEKALWASVAMIDSSSRAVNYQKWLAYTTSLNIDVAYPSFNGIGVIYNIKPSKMHAYLKDQRLKRPDYKVHPAHHQNEYWPITYIEPSILNKKAIGLDVAFETNRYVSILKAQDTGEAQVTGPIILVQDAKKTPGFLFYTPFYEGGSKPNSKDERQKKIIGVTYAPFIMDKLMMGLLAQQNRFVKVTITDRADILYAYDASGLGPNVDTSPQYESTVKVPMYGREWKFVIHSSLAFREAFANNQPVWILMGGLAIDFLLFGVFLMLSRANQRALSYADQIAVDLMEKSERLDESNKVKSEFISSMSHELRTPLTSIKGSLDLVNSKLLGPLPEKVSEMLNIASRNTRSLTLLVNDILDLEKASSGKFIMTLETIKVDALVHDCVLMNEPYAKAFNRVIETDLQAKNLTLKLDGQRFTQVLTNLLSNAIKFSGERKAVTVRTSIKNNRFRLEVQDYGEGVPIAFQSRLFDQFTQADSSDTRKNGGSGLGLHISKVLVERLGGIIGFTSKHGEGSTFFVEFDSENNHHDSSV